jgi:hypothetical protein
MQTRGLKQTARPLNAGIISDRRSLTDNSRIANRRTERMRSNNSFETKQNRHADYLRKVFAVACVFGATQVFAQDMAKPNIEKWHPKEGIYADPGPTFDATCEEGNGAYVELADNRVGFNEYGCEVRKLIDTAPGTIKLDVTCDDAQAETSLKEVVLLKRIDDNTIFWRSTSHGKFTPRGIRLAYCPEEAQRANREARALDKAEAERKAAEERAKQK